MADAVPILLMVRALGIGGTERQLVSTACSLDPSLFQVHVGCFDDQGIRRQELDEAHIPVVRFPVTSFRSFSLWTGARHMRRYVEDHGIRLVHAFDYPAILFGVPVARTCKSVVAVSSQRYHRTLRPGWPQRLQRITDRLAETVVVNCEYLARHLREEEAVPSSRISLCYNGLDIDVFHPLAEQALASRGDVLQIGVVCSPRPEKNLQTLVAAFARVRPLHPKLKLLIVGDGPCKPDLQAQALALGIAQDCTFLPTISTVADVLRSIDIFVLPSLSEALSNSLMEAMACGCCAVASATGGNVELVSDHQTGRLFPPGDVEKLTAVLRDLIENAANRKELAAKGCALLQQRFSLAASARYMESIYMSLLRNRESA